MESSTRGLRDLSAAIARDGTRVVQEDYIKSVLGKTERMYVKGIYFQRLDGKHLLESPGSFPVDHNPPLAWVQQEANRGKIFFTLLAPVNGQIRPNAGAGKSLPETQLLKVLLACAVYALPSGQVSTRGEELLGVAAIVLDLGEFLRNQLPREAVPGDLHSFWILSSEGTVLYHSDHPEMAFRNFLQKDQNCGACHASFSHVQQILRQKKGVLDYTMGGKKKLAAFYPLSIENASWFLVLNSDYEEIAGFLRKSLWGHLVLFGVIILGSGFGSLRIIRNDRLRARVEGEARDWREKQALHEKVMASEALYRTIVESAHDLIWMLDPAGCFTFANRRLEEVSGYRNSELIGRGYDSLFHPDNSEAFKSIPAETLQGGHQFEARLLAKDGRTLIVLVNAVSLNGHFLEKGILCFGRDITQRKQFELALQESERQLHAVSARLMGAQEDERRRISRELHDELGQDLNVMRMRVGFIKKKLEEDQTALREDCEATIECIDRTIENVRRISRNLSPSILQDFGLTAALRWLAEHFSNHYHIPVSLDLKGTDASFSADAQILIYRVIQEALNNIGKHAAATKVWISAGEREDNLILSVQDNGKGFDLAKVATGEAGKAGLGLATMRERAHMLGGSIEVRCVEGQGTCITLAVPTPSKQGTPT